MLHNFRNLHDFFYSLYMRNVHYFLHHLHLWHRDVLDVLLILDGPRHMDYLLPCLNVGNLDNLLHKMDLRLPHMVNDFLVLNLRDMNNLLYCGYRLWHFHHLFHDLHVRPFHNPNHLLRVDLGHLANDLLLLYNGHLHCLRHPLNLWNFNSTLHCLNFDPRDVLVHLLDLHLGHLDHPRHSCHMRHIHMAVADINTWHVHMMEIMLRPVLDGGCAHRIRHTHLWCWGDRWWRDIVEVVMLQHRGWAIAWTPVARATKKCRRGARWKTTGNWFGNASNG